MKLLPNNHVPRLLPLAITAMLAVLVACGGQTASPAETMSETATAASPTTQAPPTTAAPEPSATPRPSPTPMAMLPTQTPAPRPPPTAAPTVESTVQSQFAKQVYSTLAELTEDYSPRESASDQELKAADHLRARLDDLGYETSLQDFSVNLLRAGVELESASGDAPDSPRAIPISLSIHSSATGILAYAGRAFEEDIPAEGLEGRVALIERGVITFEEKVNRVAEAGAVGAVVFNNLEGLFLGTFFSQSRIPAVAVSQSDGGSLLALLEQGEVEATVWVGDVDSPSRNVIADKRGTSDDGRTVIIGAHYDTVADTEGANDNGSGVATVLTLAEYMAGRDYPFDVRIIFFGSEEIGLLGSNNYVDNMSEEEIENTIAMLNFDALGSGTRLDTAGDPALTDRTHAIGFDLGMEMGRFSEERWAGLGGASDHGPFRLAGIPAQYITADDKSRINSPADEIRHINADLLGMATAIGIRLLNWLAEQN